MAPRLPAHCWRQLSLPGVSTTKHTTTSVRLRLPQQIRTLTTSPSRPVKYGWSTTLPKRGAKPYDYDQVTSGLPALTTGPAAALERRKHTTPVRAGVLAVKKGMTAFMGGRASAAV